MRSLLAVPVLLVLLGAPAALRADDEAPAPAPAPSAERIEGLVRDLGAPEFKVREAAMDALLRIGEPARPALERTMRESDNMEARWRAEQILSRLDHRGERRIGEPGDAPPPEGEPQPEGTAPGGAVPPIGLPGLGGARTPEELMRQLEELRRRLFEELDRGFPSPFGDAREVLEAPGLRLEVDAFGFLPNLTLRVERTDESTGRTVAEVHRGRSLEEILRRDPGLEEHPGMPALKERWEAWKSEHPETRAMDPFPMGPGSGGPGLGGVFLRGPGSGIQITQTPDGVRVQVRETDEQGRQTVETYEGESLEAIKEQHPELKDRLDGLGGIRIHLGPPQVFRERGPAGGARLPLPPSPVTPSERDEGPVFGVQLAEVEPALAAQLPLPEGVPGVLVQAVQPGSQAEKIGLARYDVLVRIDGQAVPDREEAVRRLRKAAATPGPLTLEVIRRSQPVTLTRER